MTEQKANYGATNYDLAAEKLARMRAELPALETGLAYAAAVALLEALTLAVEAWEDAHCLT